MGLQRGGSRDYAKRRITAAFITGELTKRMKHVSAGHEGPLSFTRDHMVTLAAFGISLTQQYALTRPFILRILSAYATLYGDMGVQEFLRRRPDWIARAIEISAEAVYDAKAAPMKLTPDSPIVRLMTAQSQRRIRDLAIEQGVLGARRSARLLGAAASAAGSSAAASAAATSAAASAATTSAAASAATTSAAASAATTSAAASSTASHDEN